MKNPQPKTKLERVLERVLLNHTGKVVVSMDSDGIVLTVAKAETHAFPVLTSLDGKILCVKVKYEL